jgi:hypothetical protein
MVLRIGNRGIIPYKINYDIILGLREFYKYFTMEKYK